MTARPCWDYGAHFCVSVDFVHCFWETSSCAVSSQEGGDGIYEPWGLENLRSHNSKLRHDAHDIQVRPISEQEVPQTENLGQGGRTGAQRQDGREGVDLRRQPLGRQMHGEFRVDNGQDLVDEGQAPVHAVHGTSDVRRALAGEKGVECGKGLGFTAGCVEERGGEDVHALDIDAGLEGA